MVNDAALLHATIVAAADDLAVENEHRTDGDTALDATLARFLDSGLHKGVWGGHEGQSRCCQARLGAVAS